ncbi:MAG TPA: tripartite tricarboxylate transporter TctB family protein [Jiangellaceae bacterium]|nr:tripartite tricarboxylate transporter TctB family protein [Jiangellaceae bacterium]
MSDDRASTRAPRRWRRSYEEVIVAAVLLAGAIVLRLNIDDLVRGREGNYIGPAFWPGILLTIGIVLSAIYLVLTVIWARREDRGHEHEPQPAPGAELAAEAPAAGDSADEDLTHHGSVAKTVVGAILLTGYIYLMTGPMGFAPATVLFTAAFLLLAGERRWYVLVLVPIVAVAVVILVFTQMLSVALPRGTGFLLVLSTYLY